MARINWFVRALSASLIACIACIAWSTSIAVTVASAFDLWPAYHPSPGESIALDRAARELVDHRQPGIASRFANFAKRCLTHDEFTAGHFDPGRMPA